MRESNKQALVISTASGFLLKFELDNVRLLQSFGYTVHYAANQNEQAYPFSEEQLEAVGVIFHPITIARSPYMVRYNWKALKQLREIIHTCEIQLIHCHTPVGGVLGRLAAACFRQWNVKVVYTAHGFHFYQGAPLLNNTVYYMVEKLLARATDILVVINHEDYASGKKWKLKKNGRIYQIPGVGLDLQHFRPCGKVEKAELRRQNEIPEDAFFVLSVGELNENKNHEVILRALPRLREKDKKVIYGICGNGFYWERLHQQIDGCGLNGCVLLFGYCGDVRDYIGMADVMAFPSRREGLGMAALEALSMGVPVVAADNRGTREYMRNGVNGFLCRWNSESEFADSILKIRSMSDEDYEAMRCVCRASARPFSMRCTHEIMKSVYQKADEKVTEEWRKKR